MDAHNNKYIDQSLLDYLAAGGVVITANQRLSRYIELHYGHWCQARGMEAWPSPAIMPWQQWLESHWEQLNLSSTDELPCLLTSQQERQCWLGILQQDPADEELLQTAALAQTAQQAWGLWQQWGIAEKELVVAGNAGTTRFLQWAKAFQSLCKKNKWLDSARLSATLTEQLDPLLAYIPKEIRLAGFDEITPAQQTFIDALQHAGVSVGVVERVEVESKQHVAALADAREECLAAAQWARQQYENGARHIAVIVPDLSQRRSEVARVFDDVLCPSAVLPGSNINERPYTISMGMPLAEVPLVRLALILCQSMGRGLSYDFIGAMLHTPYIEGADAERGGRTALDIHLRNYNVVNASIWKLKAHVEHFAEGKACPQLLTQLAKCIAYLDKLPKHQTAAAWAQSFVEGLKCYGWPGRSLNSDEYQAYSHWDDVIGELAALDGFTEKLTQAAALNLLQRIAREKVFQTKSAPAPIQVLGALESVGMRFDAIWVAGLTDELWPPAANPNALLPVSVQRQHSLPHASAEREYEFIHTLHKRIASSADEIVFSWPGMDGDKELAPSPFIADVDLADYKFGKAELSPYAKSIHDAATALEHELDAAIPLVAGEQTRGGTGLIKQQSACPFSAFACYRLNIKPLEEPEVGLDPRQRGSLMHDVMQAIWEKLQSHQQLCALDDIGATIKPIVDTRVDVFMQQQPQQSPKRFVELEKDRLLKRVVQWLEAEKQRTPFTIAALEKKSTTAIGDLQINTQIDRLDKTDQGLIAIDYKTNEPRPAAWLGDRPEEPQLPMYVEYDALMQDNAVAGVLFGCLKKGAKQPFAGIVAEDIKAPGAKPPEKQRAFKDMDFKTMDEVRAHWKQTLSDLANAYMSGDANVDPRDANACMYCGLESLCRIHELDKRLEHGEQQKGAD
ncbi:MAG: PD-(D/E)XK nuclease family protein [Proteobacteria bacterium]|nr:PD-(D/E)XK nuclease family protein [Pseudomonadota bacterium]